MLLLWLRLCLLCCINQQVDPELRRALLDEALETQEQDNEELLKKVRQRLDRCAHPATLSSGSCVVSGCQFLCPAAEAASLLLTAYTDSPGLPQLLCAD